MGGGRRGGPQGVTGHLLQNTRGRGQTGEGGQGGRGQVGQREQGPGGAGGQRCAGDGAGAAELVGERPLEGVGGGGLAIIQIQRGEHWGYRGGRGQARGSPGGAHGPVHLLESRHIARLLEKLNTHRCLPLPFGPESITLVHSGEVISWRAVQSREGDAGHRRGSERVDGSSPITVIMWRRDNFTY